jgi:hypothetical protein
MVEVVGASIHHEDRAMPTVGAGSWRRVATRNPAPPAARIAHTRIMKSAQRLIDFFYAFAGSTISIVYVPSVPLVNTYQA